LARYTVCGRRVLRAPLPAALVYARCPAPGPATQPTESDEEVSEPPFFTHAAQLQAESARLTRAGWSASSVGRRLCSGPTRPGQPPKPMCQKSASFVGCMTSRLARAACESQWDTAGKSLARLCSGTTRWAACLLHQWARVCPVRRLCSGYNV